MANDTVIAAFFRHFPSRIYMIVCIFSLSFQISRIEMYIINLYVYAVYDMVVQSKANYFPKQNKITKRTIQDDRIEEIFHIFISVVKLKCGPHTDHLQINNNYRGNLMPYISLSGWTNWLSILFFRISIQSGKKNNGIPFRSVKIPVANSATVACHMQSMQR